MIISHTSLDNFHDTATAQRADELAHAYVETINSADDDALDTVLARDFLSYSREGVHSSRVTHTIVRRNMIRSTACVSKYTRTTACSVENNLIAPSPIMTGILSGPSADFLRIEDGVVAQHRGAMDYVAMYQSFSLLAEPSGLAHPPLQHPQSTR
jgi:hypothetical protein